MLYHLTAYIVRFLFPNLTHPGCGVRCLEGWGTPFLHSSHCVSRKKMDRVLEHKDHISECTSSTGQRKVCHNSPRYTTDHKSAVKCELGERWPAQKACLKNKRVFFGSFSFKGRPGLQSGLMGISTFLPNKEQGFHVRKRAAAVDQVTSLNPHSIFSPLAWETQGKRLGTSREYQELGRSAETRRWTTMNSWCFTESHWWKDEGTLQET